MATVPAFSLGGGTENRSMADDLKFGGGGNTALEALPDEQPTFPGGESGLENFIGENMNYPDDAAKRGVQGRVQVRFIVGQDGTLSDVKVVASIDPALDKEAIRLVKAMPAWNPSTRGGVPIRVYYTLPITFTLNNSFENKDLTHKATFPGGQEALAKYLADNAKYIAEARNRGARGRVIVGFNVEPDGTLSDVTVIKKVDPLLDAEAVRAVKAMPRWNPGKRYNKPVKAHCVIPITFKP